MAAYAALVSVMHIIDDLQQHPHPPIYLHKQQLESLTQKITFLQDFLETHNGCNSQEADVLESRIADAAHAAEDVIESHIVDQILTRSTTHEENICGADLYEGLQKVIEDMDSIQKVVTELKQDQVQRNSMPVRSSTSSSTQQSSLIACFSDVLLELMNKLTRALSHCGVIPVVGPVRSSTLSSAQPSNLTVGIDDVLLKLMDKLIGKPSHRTVIPIVGMGGIGKTTLARSIYLHQTVLQHFDFLAWATISQQCILKEVLLEVLHGVGKDRAELRDINEHDLGEILHQHLFGRKYLIIMDDIWDVKIWEQLKFYFPNNNNGSRVVLTTRLSALARDVSDSHGIFQLGFLNWRDSWNMFCRIVFGEEDCPLELEEIAEKIVKSCRGLPMSIIVIGGLLSVSAHTPQKWEYIAENLSSIVNLDDNEHSLKVLYTSYNNLPVYLKPGFLYMGVFREDSWICVRDLINRWVAEGFLKSRDGRSLEDSAYEYLEELVDRNLILVDSRSYSGKLETCKIHDLLRDLCLREARKQKFLCVLGGHSCYKISQDSDSERRIWSYEGTQLDSLSVARSLIFKEEQPQLPMCGGRLLRLYATETLSHRESYLQHLLVVLQRVNLRYINIGKSLFTYDQFFVLPSSIYLLWNLQTLNLSVPGFYEMVDVTFEIWKMPRLRHVKIWPHFELPNPPEDDGFVLENLQTLSQVVNLKCGEEVVKRIPNIKKLALFYPEWQSHDYCLSNIVHLHKLATLCIRNFKSDLSIQMPSLTLPHSLRKLSLIGTALPWEGMTGMVRSLPLLEVLQLRIHACVGSEWITSEGQFCSLKVLEIYEADLEYWETEKEHFPCLEHILLFEIELKEVPSCIGDIDSLQSFTLQRCFHSAWDSAQRIREEQQELENTTLRFDICGEDKINKEWRK